MMTGKKPKSKPRHQGDAWGALHPDNPQARPLHRAPKPVKLADDPVENPKK